MDTETQEIIDILNGSMELLRLQDEIDILLHCLHAPGVDPRVLWDASRQYQRLLVSVDMSAYPTIERDINLFFASGSPPQRFALMKQINSALYAQWNHECKQEDSAPSHRKLN